MTIITVGIDLAKNVFSVHGVDENGKAALRRTVRRNQLLELIATLPPCVIAMEACSGAHHWARQFAAFGHTPKLIAPKFVTPYRMSGKRGKNDAADAAAICEAATRPKMRFVPIKTVDQQGTLCVHRVRQGFIEDAETLIAVSLGHVAKHIVVGPVLLDYIQNVFDGSPVYRPIWI